MKGTSINNQPKALIEDVLELTPVFGLGPDILTNTNPLWRPPGNRGIFGGILIAQTLAAAQKTITDGFLARSMHCYFVFAGDGELPILYHVDRVVDTQGYLIRAVSAKQNDRLIFYATFNFTKATVDRIGKPDYAVPPPSVDPPIDVESGWDANRPFQSLDATFEQSSTRPEDKKIRQWARARGKISTSGGQQAHLGAMAYLSDSFFLGTVHRVHSVRRFSSPTALQRLEAVKSQTNPDMGALEYFQSLADIESRDFSGIYQEDKEVGMMVSLSHSIYFHHPASVRADDWMLTQMESPWAGDERGMVLSRWWNSDGNLIATCIQEGVMRLNEIDPTNPRSRKL